MIDYIPDEEFRIQFHYFCEVVTTCTPSAIFEPLVSGRDRSKYYESAYYHAVISQDDKKRRVVMQPLRRSLSQCVDELRTRYGNLDITAIF